jgi:hypothetical protein
MVPQVRLRLRCPAEKEASSVRSEVAPGRSLHQDEWNPALLVAGRRPERSGHRYLGAAAPGPLGSFAFLFASYSIRQKEHRVIITDKLRSYAAAKKLIFAERGTPTEPLSEQSSQELTSANPHARKADEALSISRAGSTFSLCARVDQRYLSLALPSPLRSPPSAAAQASVSPLEQDRHRGSPSIARHVCRSLFPALMLHRSPLS